MPLRIAHAVRPDLRAHAGLADEGVVLRHAALGREPHDLALQLVKLLRGGPLVVFAQRDEEIALVVEHQARPEVIAGGELGLLAEDHLEVADRALVVGQPAIADRRARLAVARFGVRQVYAPILREAGREHHVEQAALALGPHARHAGERRRQLARAVEQAQPARPLGDQHAAVGQEGQAPGMFEAARDFADLGLHLLRREALHGLGWREGRAGQGQRARPCGELQARPRGRGQDEGGTRARASGSVRSDGRRTVKRH
ncbi:spermatogenesis-associated protein 21 [Corchorus olitorius]|uniref:Spermatogenesis-associated protein 21 n=1 Tax=Corchorus olitorius TaxID=93759 RepID=A0A1R3L0J2_9ROSI|nr:spermatogenesis-associated protein 21 [Corchorus olitorius]